MKLTDLRKILDENGFQVCATETETCRFFQSARPDYNARCSYCERGIIDKKPHRLCPDTSPRPPAKP